MNLRQIIDIVREEVGDTKRPYLVSDTMMAYYANRVETMAARQARLIVETQEVPVSAGEPTVDIDPKIISIRRARISTNPMPLAYRKVRDMDERYPGWDTTVMQSIPGVLVTDYASNQARLYPTPQADATLYLTVTRGPAAEMAEDEDEPEINARYHYGLIDGMKWLITSKEDSDLYDAKMSKMALESFVAEFGPVISAVDEQYEFENYHDIGER